MKDEKNLGLPRCGTWYLSNNEIENGITLGNDLHQKDRKKTI